jgi:hypothetical protein
MNEEYGEGHMAKKQIPGTRKFWDTSKYTITSHSRPPHNNASFQKGMQGKWSFDVS